MCVCQSPSSNVKHTSCEDAHLVPRYDMTKGLAQDAVAADVIQLQVVHLALPQRTAWPQDVGAPTRLWPCALAVEPLCKRIRAAVQASEDSSCTVCTVWNPLAHRRTNLFRAPKRNNAAPSVVDPVLCV